MLGLWLLWNLAVFLLFGWDKRMAIKGGPRIPERTLLTMSLLLGGAGGFFGSVIFHHKTRKRIFQVLLPIALVISVAGLIFLLYKLAL